jgi:serine phosphatase RsbU (regulator of sigma subunit)
LGIEKVSEFLKNSAGKTTEEIIQNILAKSKSWSENSPLQDDLTIVALKLNGTLS